MHVYTEVVENRPSKFTPHRGAALPKLGLRVPMMKRLIRSCRMVGTQRAYTGEVKRDVVACTTKRSKVGDG